MSDLMTRDEPQRDGNTDPRELTPLSQPSPANQMLDVIARAAADPRCDVGKMEALLRMQRELMADQARAEFNQDFAAMQPKLPGIPKRGIVDRGVGKGSFPYGKWETIDEMIRPLLNEHGFSLSFTTEPSPQGGVIVTGTLRHRSGHEKTASIGPLPADNSGGKNPVQAAGSTFSYARRYTTTMLLNLTFEGADTDGERVGDDEFIDEDQRREINAILREPGQGAPGFLAYMHVHDVAAILRRDYQKAMNALMARRAEYEEEQRQKQGASYASP